MSAGDNSPLAVIKAALATLEARETATIERERETDEKLKGFIGHFASLGQLIQETVTATEKGLGLELSFPETKGSSKDFEELEDQLVRVKAEVEAAMAAQGPELEKLRRDLEEEKKTNQSLNEANDLQGKYLESLNVELAALRKGEAPPAPDMKELLELRAQVKTLTKERDLYKGEIAHRDEALKKAAPETTMSAAFANTESKRVIRRSTPPPPPAAEIERAVLPSRQRENPNKDLADRQNARAPEDIVFGRKVQEARDACGGWSQTELATQLRPYMKKGGVGRGMISKVESGEPCPPMLKEIIEKYLFAKWVPENRPKSAPRIPLAAGNTANRVRPPNGNKP